jgi:hypothetical protein
MCGELPWPGVANVTLPGFFFASAIKSATELIGDETGTTSRLGKLQSSETGAKSATGSY